MLTLSSKQLGYLNWSGRGLAQTNQPNPVFPQRSALELSHSNSRNLGYFHTLHAINRKVENGIKWRIVL